MMFDHLIISISAKVSYLIKNYHYLITPILDLRTLEKPAFKMLPFVRKLSPGPQEVRICCPKCLVQLGPKAPESERGESDPTQWYAMAILVGSGLS